MVGPEATTPGSAPANVGDDERVDRTAGGPCHPTAFDRREMTSDQVQLLDVGPPGYELSRHFRQKAGGHALSGRFTERGAAPGHQGDDVHRRRRAPNGLEDRCSRLEACRPGHRVIADHQPHRVGHRLRMIGHAYTAGDVEHRGGAACHRCGRLSDGDDQGPVRVPSGQRSSSEGFGLHCTQTGLEPAQHLDPGDGIGGEDPGIETGGHVRSASQAPSGWRRADSRSAKVSMS